MSLGVSQIDYWREANKPDKNTSTNTTNDTNSGPGAIYLSYDVFLGLSVLGGLLALDHLYLRSPLTFLAKIIVNILTLGTWWLYDASQAVFNKDVVKVFGLGVPGMGPKGIGAGVLANDVPDKKHMAFFVYALALIFGGLFGLDSFIVGDKQSGIIRIICLITGIFAPIAIFWWLFNICKFFIKTKDVTSKYWEYFGAPPPAEYGKSFIEKLVQKFPFLDYIVGPITKIKDAIFGTINNVEDLKEAVLENPVGTIESIVASPISYAKDTIGKLTDEAGNILTGPLQLATTAIETELKPAEAVLETAIKPVINAVQPLKETLNKGLSVAEDSLVLGKNALNRGSQLASNTLKVVGQTANAATKALTLVPAAAALTDGFTEQAAQAALTKLKQDGGGNSGILAYVMLGTLAIIVVSGLTLTYRRFRQNGQPRKDDHPPNPETPITRVL